MFYYSTGTPNIAVPFFKHIRSNLKSFSPPHLVCLGKIPTPVSNTNVHFTLKWARQEENGNFKGIVWCQLFTHFELNPCIIQVVITL